MKTTISRSAFGILAVLAVSFPGASAAMPFSEYEKARKADPSSVAAILMRTHVGALGSAFQFANIALEEEGRAPLFCAPQNIALNPENYLQFIDESLARVRDTATASGLPVSGLLLVTLKQKFPCKNAGGRP